MSPAAPALARTVLAVALAMLAVACAPAPTRIVVVAESDLQVPAQADGVRFVIDGRAIGSEVQQRDIGVDGTRVAFPLVLPIVHQGGALGPITIEATALRGGEVIVRRAVRTSFVRERSVVLVLALTHACAGIACGADESCSAGACETIDVDPSTLPIWTGRGGLDAIAMGDGDAGVALPDAVPSLDAGSCGSGCACEQSCESECGCAGGCGCDLTCPAGATCESVRCEGAATECAIDARGASNVDAQCSRGARCALDALGASNVRDLVCRDGAICDADCRETSNCVVKCESGSSCSLRCDERADDNCRLECDGALSDCGSGLFVCDRSCP